VCTCIVVGGVFAVFSPIFPYLYNTSDDVRMLATRFMQANAVYMAFNAVSNCAYFTIRSGGKTFITFLFDSVYTWVFFVPLTYVLTHFTTLDILILYPVCHLAEVMKCILGIIVVKYGNWAQNMVSDKVTDKSIETSVDVT